MAEGKKRISTTPIERFSNLVRDDAILRYAPTFCYEKGGVKTEETYPIWNQLCTAIVRIQDAVDYLNEFVFSHKNKHREAFDFYEFLDCCAIVLGCVERIFSDFGKNFAETHATKDSFKKSNLSDASDIKFFKFIRSACAVHPESTDRYEKIVREPHEYYPYAAWNDGATYDGKENFPKDCDIVLSAWNDDQSCFDKDYYLYLDEFYEFIGKTVSCLPELSTKISDIKDEYRSTRKCAALKEEADFCDSSEYCKYLRSVLFEKNDKPHEPPDGGLLIASHLFGNDIISLDFKDIMMKKVDELKRKMAQDIDQIGFCDIYDEFRDLKDVKECFSDCSQLTFKELESLEKEAKREIERNSPRVFRDSNQSCFDETLAYARCASDKLIRSQGLFKEASLSRAETFLDLFELLLQSVWEKQKSKKPMEGK